MPAALCLLSWGFPFTSTASQDYLPQLTRISDIAAKEYAIERGLEELSQTWKALKFELIPYKATGINILKGASVEELTLALQDAAIKVQSMSSSSSAAPFRAELEAQQLFIRKLEVWLRCFGQCSQLLWLTLFRPM